MHGDRAFQDSTCGCAGSFRGATPPEVVPLQSLPSSLFSRDRLPKVHPSSQVEISIALAEPRKKLTCTNITSQLVHENAPQNPPRQPPRFNSCQSSSSVESRLQSRLGIKHQHKKDSPRSFRRSKSLLSPSQTKPKLCCHRSPGTKLLKASSQNGSQQLHKPQHLS